MSLLANVCMTTRYIDFTLDRVRMLRHYGVIPFMVFDGDYLPGKAGTELEREKYLTISCCFERIRMA